MRQESCQTGTTRDSYSAGGLAIASIHCKDRLVYKWPNLIFRLLELDFEMTALPEQAHGGLETL
jgi:hypothetical protein